MCLVCVAHDTSNVCVCVFYHSAWAPVVSRRRRGKDARLQKQETAAQLSTQFVVTSDGASLVVVQESRHGKASYLDGILLSYFFVWWWAFL